MEGALWSLEDQLAAPRRDVGGEIFRNPSPLGIISTNDNDLLKVKFFLGSLHPLSDKQRNTPVPTVHWGVTGALTGILLVP